MKTVQKLAVFLMFPILCFSVSSCSKDDSSSAYTCQSCHDTPDALVANDGSVEGIYKGIIVGSTGTIAINIQNGSSTITATMVLDGISSVLTSNVSVVAGQTYVAPFTGTYNGTAITLHLTVGLGGTLPTMTSSDIPGHANAVFEIYKETSTSLIEAFQGTYSKPGENGTFNILASRGLAIWGGIAKPDDSSETNDASGTINSSNQLVEDNGTILATINGDVLSGSFIDGNGATIHISGHRTL